MSPGRFDIDKTKKRTHTRKNSTILKLIWGYRRSKKQPKKDNTLYKYMGISTKQKTAKKRQYTLDLNWTHYGTTNELSLFIAMTTSSTTTFLGLFTSSISQPPPLASLSHQHDLGLRHPVTEIHGNTSAIFLRQMHPVLANHSHLPNLR